MDPKTYWESETARRRSVLDPLVASGDIRSYQVFGWKESPPDGSDDLVILVFPSGRQLAVSAGSLSSQGLLGLR